MTGGLREKLIDMRMEYTAEPQALAEEVITAALPRLNSQDRAAIVDDLWGGGTMFVRRARRRLLPGTSSAKQQWLESMVLAGLASAVELVDKMSSPIEWVTPRTGDVIIKLHPQATLPFLATFMPRMVDGVLVGMPSMRVRVSRRSLLIYSLYSPEDKVLLASNPSGRWNETASHIIDVTGDVNAVSLWGPPVGLVDSLSEAKPHPVTDAEAAARAAYRWQPTIDSLGSALLRRSGLSAGIGVWRRDGKQFTLTARDPATIEKALRNRLFGVSYRAFSDSQSVAVTTERESRD